MTTLNGHFDGKHIVLDEPIPPSLTPNTLVKIVFEHTGEESVLDKIAKLAVPIDGLPTDYSEQHDHYVRATPKR